MRSWLLVGLATSATLAGWLLFQGAASSNTDERLARYRNLGKAFYENPTTQKEAVEEFKKALDLYPKSNRERLNYGLALLRAGRTPEGIAELQKVQKSDPAIPHTWFNLGIEYKKQNETDKSIEQLEGMAKLVPDEPITHYNLGALYKIKGDTARAIKEFEIAAKLDPNLAAPHFQLFNVYRIAGRMPDAQRELATFQRLKAAQGSSSEDVDWSPYAEIYDIMANTPSSDPAAKVAFTPTQLVGTVNGVRLIDAMGDGKIETLTWSQQDLSLTPGNKIADIAGIVDVAPGDFNNDGLVDLCVVTASGPMLLVNRGNGKFEKFDAKLPKGQFTKALWLDYDHDFDLDLFLLGKTSVLLRNQGEAGFEDHTADFPFEKGEALDAVRFRVVADTKGLDLAVSYKDRGGVLYRDRLQGKYTAEPLPLPNGAHNLEAVDINNDGWFDVLYSIADRIEVLRNNRTSFATPAPIVPSAAAGFVAVDTENRGVQDLIAAGSIYRNTGDGNFEQTKAVTLPNCRSGAAADLNGDGKVDFVCIGDAQAQSFANATTSKNAWTAIRLVGIKNLKTAVAAEVEVKAGGRYQKQNYDGLPLTFGIGLEQGIDTVRTTWANGLIQNEMKQPVDKVLKYDEAQRLSGSCPMIWTWNGKRYQYITDVLGVAPLGASSGDGQYFPVDHTEYIQIPAGALESKDGQYEVHITEELSEVAYLDHVRLIAVDHPANTNIYLNEKFKSPPFPEFRLYGVDQKLYPRSAHDDKGRDVLAKILKVDRAYPDTFHRNLSGVADLHTLDLDFGSSAAPDNKAVLVLNGWVDWADGSTFFAAAQESKQRLITPYLQVKDKDGNWKTVIEDMGMPAGKPKTIAVDLTGKFLSSSREVRIVTNLCVYWDEIFLGNNAGQPRTTLATVPQSYADLHFRGFSPNYIDPQRKQPEQFFYEDARETSMWNPTPGMYTRYGDVRELTAAVDDKMIVMGSGDELRMRFDARSLKAVPQGWTRDFLLMVDGWAKDRDANTAYSQSTDPLPFHAMSRFPYPANEHYPDDAEHQRYRREYLTRPALKLMRPLVASR